MYYKHGLSKSQHYKRWQSMLSRCENPQDSSYMNYGGRGIKVCKRWHDITKFVADLPDGYWPGAQIDRIKNDQDYKPGNIKWSTRSQNCDNRRSGHPVKFQGKTQSLRCWAEELSISEGTLWERLNVWQWSIKKALTTAPMTPHERMAKAHETRWLGHVKPPPPPTKVYREVEYQGKVMRLKELSEVTGISTKLLAKRIYERGWSVEKATGQGFFKK